MGVAVPASASVTVYRMVQGHRVAFTHTERFSEACGTKKKWENKRVVGETLNSMWTRRPYAQLAKCAEAGALRKAFPEELGSTYVPEEVAGGEILDMGQADRVDPEDLTPRAVGETEKETAIDAEAAPDSFQQEYAKAETRKATEPKPEPAPSGPKQVIGQGPLKLLSAKLTTSSMSKEDLCQHFGIPDLPLLPMDKINEALELVSK